MVQLLFLWKCSGIRYHPELPPTAWWVCALFESSHCGKHSFSCNALIPLRVVLTVSYPKFPVEQEARLLSQQKENEDVRMVITCTPTVSMEISCAPEV